ncbi:MAG: hypothetical protein IIV08_04660 [Selenomonadales bacterium]|nr:hypothetical protein [Selenomonadales bacterium]
MPLGMITLLVVLALVYFGTAQRILDRMRLTDKQAIVLLLAIGIGSFFDIPVMSSPTVLTIDKRNKKIALSIRQVQQDAERAEYKAYMKEQEDKNVAFGNQLGDLLKDFEV